MKVYVVCFTYENDFEVEGIFKTKELAKKYILQEAILRGLLIPEEIWIEEEEIIDNVPDRDLMFLARELDMTVDDIKRIKKKVESL